MGPATVLTIAGSDSGGGAGIQADLAAIAWFGGFGTTAITAVTAQNPSAVTGVYPIPPEGVAAQIAAVFSAFSVGAVKTGMLFSSPLIETVAAAVAVHRPRWLVVDPVMVATSGARLLRDDAVEALRERLLPRASLITPNLPEAEVLVGRRLAGVAEARQAALELASRDGAWVLVKGGHGQGDVAIDVLAHGAQCWEYRAPRVGAATTHGTGCSLSAAIAVCLAQGDTPLVAVRRAKAYVLARLRNCIQVGPEAWAMAPPEALPDTEVVVAEVADGRP